jgi:hypothetical protein
MRSPSSCSCSRPSEVEVPMNGPNQGNSLPLTVASPDLAGGTFPREFTCDGANRLPRLQWSTPPAGAQELAIEMLDPDAPGGHLHPLAGLRAPSRHLRPGSCPGQRRRRRQRLRPPRLRRPVPTAGCCAPLPLRGPGAGHPARTGRRSDPVRFGSTHHRPRTRQGRTRRDLPARLIGYLPAPASRPETQHRSRRYERHLTTIASKKARA